MTQAIRDLLVWWHPFFKLTVWLTTDSPLSSFWSNSPGTAISPKAPHLSNTEMNITHYFLKWPIIFRVFSTLLKISTFLASKVEFWVRSSQMSLTDTLSREANAQNRILLSYVLGIGFSGECIAKTHLPWPYSKLDQVVILNKVENNRPYSKYDRKIIGHFKK